MITPEPALNGSTVPSRLLTPTSTATTEGWTSLADYVSRMKEGQAAIYYITADSLAAAKNSPQLEIFKKKGIEVLLLTDRVDEWMLSNIPGEQRARLGSYTGNQK